MPGARVLREAPVQQAGGLIPVGRAALFDQAVHHRDHQSTSVSVGGGDERLPGRIGETGLAADRAGIAVQQLVLVDQRLVAGLGREHGRRLRGDLREHRVGHRGAEDDRQVARRGEPRCRPGRRGPTALPRACPSRRGAPPWRSSSPPRCRSRRSCRRAHWPRRCPTSAAPRRAAGVRCRCDPVRCPRSCTRRGCRPRCRRRSRPGWAARRARSAPAAS